MVDKLIALGIISVLDLEDVGSAPLISELEIEESLAGSIVKAASSYAKKLAAEAKNNQAQDVLRKETEDLEQ